MLQRPFLPTENLVHFGDFEFLGLKCPADSTDSVLVLLMGGVEDDLQKVLIAGHATHILRRTVALTGKADRLHRNFGLHDLLQNDLMLPVITKVVNVNHRVAF